MNWEAIGIVILALVLLLIREAILINRSQIPPEDEDGQ